MSRVTPNTSIYRDFLLGAKYLSLFTINVPNKDTKKVHFDILLVNPFFKVIFKVFTLSSVR